jgi:hypothetical protein
MNIEDIATGRAGPIALSSIGGDRTLARQVQERLTEAGLLEPPADGDFGPVSHWAMEAFLRKVGMPGKGSLDKTAGQALLSTTIGSLFPLNSTTTLAGRIASAFQNESWWITRHPDCINIVYVEGLDADGSINDDAPNIFNDLRLLLRVNRSGNAEIVGCWEATSEPGTYFTKLKKEDPRGAARIAFGQYKSWSVGMHPRSTPTVAYEALVQVKDITVCRDLNEDFERNGDATFSGLFGINQHWGYDMPKNNIGNASAGCLVGRTKNGHREFMSLVKADPRYGASRGFRFMTAVMPASSLP